MAATATPVRIRRSKNGRTFFAKKLVGGAVAEWSPSESDAGAFDRSEADAVLARVKEAARLGSPTGRVSILAGKKEIAAVGEELTGFEPISQAEGTAPELDAAEAEALADPNTITYTAGTPPCEVVIDSSRPVIRLAFASKPLTPTRTATIDAHRDLRAEINAAIHAPDSGAANYFGVKKQIDDHAASTAGTVKELTAQIAKLEQDREAVEADVSAPGLTARLREVDDKLTDARRQLADVEADGARLRKLLARHRGAAETAISSVAVATRRKRQRELVQQAREIAGHIGTTMADELAALHEAWIALVSLETADHDTLVRAAVYQAIGHDPAA